MLFPTMQCTWPEPPLQVKTRRHISGDFNLYPVKSTIMAMSFFCVSQNKYHALLEHAQVHIAHKKTIQLYMTHYANISNSMHYCCHMTSLVAFSDQDTIKSGNLVFQCQSDHLCAAFTLIFPYNLLTPVPSKMFMYFFHGKHSMNYLHVVSFNGLPTVEG